MHNLDKIVPILKRLSNTFSAHITENAGRTFVTPSKNRSRIRKISRIVLTPTTESWLDP
jgi:hypothetical protein